MGDVMITVGADIGNATALIGIDHGGKQTIVKMPSAKAAIGLRLPAKLGKDDHVITREHDGVPVPVALGMTALMYADEPSPARGNADRYGRWTLDFILAGIAATVKAPRVVVALVVCVPAEIAPQVRDAVTLAMRGKHRINHNGRAVEIEIRRVTVVREGEAALSVLGASDGRAILVDGGGGTTHVALSRNGVLVDVVTRNIGVQRILDDADRVVAQRFGRRLSMLERAELEQAIAAGQVYHIIINGKPERVDSIARAYFDGVADSMINDIKAIVPAWRSFHAVYLAGGAAYHLRSHFEAAFPNIKVPARPEELNVRGALAMAGIAVSQEGEDVAA